MQKLQERVSLTELLTRDDILQGLATRDMLLAHGVRLFHRFGVNGTSVGKILEATGKSKSQFYSHFSDKDDFVCKVLELQMGTMIRVGRRYKVEKVEDLVSWFAPYLELASLPENLGCPVGPLASELSPARGSIREEAGKQFHRWQQHIIEMLRGLATCEDFSEDFDPEAIGRNLSYSIQGAFLMGRVFQSHQAIEEVRDNCVQQCLQWRIRSLKPSL